MFFTIYALEGNKSYVTTENLGHAQGYTLTLSWPLTVVKGWQLQTNVLGYYSRFQYDYEGTLLHIQNVAGRFNGNNAFTLGKGWTAELNGWVSTPAVNGIWRSPWLGALDTGVQKAVSSALKLKFSVQLSTFYVAGITLLFWRTSAWLLCALVAVGRMGLTTYLMQTVSGVLVFLGYGLGQVGKLGMAASIGIGLVFFAGQIPFANWWLSRFHYGPVEWLWRSLTYGKAQPWRKRSKEPVLA